MRLCCNSLVSQTLLGMQWLCIHPRVQSALPCCTNALPHGAVLSLTCPGKNLAPRLPTAAGSLMGPVDVLKASSFISPHAAACCCCVQLGRLTACPASAPASASWARTGLARPNALIVYTAAKREPCAVGFRCTNSQGSSRAAMPALLSNYPLRCVV